MPPVSRQPGKTGLLYQNLRPQHYTDGRITAQFVDRMSARREFDDSLLFNTFENVAYNVYSGLEAAKQHLAKIGGGNIHVAGSGPALFSVFKNRSEAEELFASLKGQRLDAYLAETVEARR
jgi:4-diphosphocytidyl-2-C-methyl-D-erythritol kinase